MTRRDDALLARVAELLTVIGDGLRPPYVDPAADSGGWVRRDALIADRAAVIGSAALAVGESLSSSQPAMVLDDALAAIRGAVERRPVTYPTRDHDEVQP